MITVINLTINRQKNYQTKLAYTHTTIRANDRQSLVTLTVSSSHGSE